MDEKKKGITAEFPDSLEASMPLTTPPASRQTERLKYRSQYSQGS